MGSLKRRGESHDKPRVKPSGKAPDEGVSGSDSESESLFKLSGRGERKSPVEPPKDGFALNYLNDNAASITGGGELFEAAEAGELEDALKSMGLGENEAAVVNGMFTMMSDLIGAYDKVMADPSEKNIKTYSLMLEAAYKFPNEKMVLSLISAGIAALSVIRHAEGGK